ncbi:DUF4192 domain-containing protein [Glycomyces buryatensis]|uniref:DUF4192 domain-containing protein n=1 Tax=Glycomyces buryatensis TaxID=2570927 RepID=A0A4V4HSH7_9ACTN|nr:DUF4192 domain-containing protein [Glycomyces buryatensis]THV41596.1 DUF4192 domain-containing protein [Glycomyces buryatensis]
MDMTQAKISLTGPDDLLTTIPLLLGFHPEQSLVVVGLVDGDLECTFRVDLPGSAEHIEHLVDLTGQLSLNNCNQCVLIAYGDKDVAEAALERTKSRCDAAGIKPIERLRVSSGRWHGLDCPPDHSCPVAGSLIPETSAAACEVAVAGWYAAPDRETVAAQLQAAAPGRRAAVASSVEAILGGEVELDWAEQRGRDLHAVDHWLEAKELPDTDDIATLGLALGDLDIRDYALRRINSGRFERGRVDLWIWVARHLEEDLVAPAATVAGFAAYRSGNGVLALEAFELALRSSPHYRLAQMLMAALQSGLPPNALARIGGGDAEEMRGD